MLHWGVKQPGRGSDWIRPADNLLPPGSNLDQDAIAADTPFQTCNGALLLPECFCCSRGSAPPPF